MKTILILVLLATTIAACNPDNDPGPSATGGQPAEQNPCASKAKVSGHEQPKPEECTR